MLEMPRFSITGYRQLLTALTSADYRIVPTDSPDQDGPTCLLRHDVDIHLESAELIASIEREYGASSTWFVPVTFCFNVMHEPNQRMLRNLVALGHSIGLHYDPDQTQGIEDIHFQVRLLERATGTRIRSITAHKPGHSKRGLRQSAYLQPSHRNYVSDSARRWRDDNLLKLIEGREDFMLLTHHEHWLSGEDGLLNHFADSILPRTVKQAHAHASLTLNDCLTHR
jgi:hypothetical protein